MKMIIFGLGKIGRELLEYCKQYQKDMDAEIVAVIDSNVDKLSLNEYARNLYKQKEDIHHLSYEYIVIASAKYYDEIKEELISIFHVDAFRIISYKEFYKRLKTAGEKECNMCGATPVLWEYLGQNNQLFMKKQITGAGRRKGLCPACKAMDRTRYVYYILNRFTDIFADEKGKNVLHFAPEHNLRNKFLQTGLNYITADIAPGRADIVADITNLPFEDDSFDYIICNHVLEHINNETKALSELRRCLKENGKAIVTVPICWSDKTYEKADIVTPEDRTLYYGQSDHVRLYGNDTEQRFIQGGGGFQVQSYKCNELLSEADTQKYGFIHNDTVFILKK